MAWMQRGKKKEQFVEELAAIVINAQEATHYDTTGHYKDAEIAYLDVARELLSLSRLSTDPQKRDLLRINVQYLYYFKLFLMYALGHHKLVSRER